MPVRRWRFAESGNLSKPNCHTNPREPVRSGVIQSHTSSNIPLDIFCHFERHATVGVVLCLRRFGAVRHKRKPLCIRSNLIVQRITDGPRLCPFGLGIPAVVIDSEIELRTSCGTDHVSNIPSIEPIDSR